MKKILLILLIACTAQITNSQTPGNVGNLNLTAWFKTDGLPTGNLSSWSTTFPSGAGAITLTDNLSPFPQISDGITGPALNYNSVVDFTGSTLSALMALENGGALNLLDNSNINEEGTFFVVYHLPASAVCTGCHVVNYREATSGIVDGIQFRVLLGSNGRIAIGSGNSSNASRDFPQTFLPDIISYNGNRSGTGTMKTYQRSLLFTGGSASGTTGEQGMYFGVRKFGGTNYNAQFDGQLAEVIFYNRDLTDTEYDKVHTYLALKYGITLANNSGGTQGDYIASDGTLIWDASINPAYHKDLIGLCREDSEGFMQKQSHTFDGITKIFVGTSLALTNIANTGTINSDTSYIMMGHNSGAMCESASANLEVPSGSTTIYSRLEREWKISNNNFNGDFSTSFTLNSCPSNSALIMSDAKLLVDDDGVFTNASVYDSNNGLTFNLSNGVITVQGISNAVVPINQTNYITVAFGTVNTFIPEHSKDEIIIYPNPTKDIITIKATGKELEEVSLYNELGAILNSSVVFKTINNSTKSINMSKLPAGNYMVKTKSNVTKIVKQ